MSLDTALIIMDFQNDFCLPQGIGAEYRGDLSRLDGVAERIVCSIVFARRHNIEVMFVNFLGDEKYQRPSWRERDRLMAKRPKCLEGSWGAQLHKLTPLPSERVFFKHAHFDAFLNDDFSSFMAQRAYQKLIFAGLYCDVCIDTTARTAFQKGYSVALLKDCTTTLHLPEDQCLTFMRKVYGMSIMTHDEFVVGVRA